MRNTLYIRKEYIADEVIAALSFQFKLFTIDVIDNDESYEITFKPDSKQINDLKSQVRHILEQKGKVSEDLDVVLNSTVMTSLATGYSKIYSILMQHILTHYVSIEIKDKEKALSIMMNVAKEIQEYEKVNGSLFDAVRD